MADLADLVSKTVHWSAFGHELLKHAGTVEVAHNFHPVTVQPPQAKRAKFPFTGFIDFQGLKIDVENKKGEYRRGKDRDGHEWKCLMHAHYGEIRNTEGTDGDKLDVYVGPNHDSSLVVVVRQHKPDTGAFDEDKVMVGFDSVEEAIGAYKKQYDKPGFYRDGDYEAMPIGEFWRWVHDRGNHGKKVAGVVSAAGNAVKDTLAGVLSPHRGKLLLGAAALTVGGGMMAKNKMQKTDPPHYAPPGPSTQVAPSPWSKGASVLSKLAGELPGVGDEAERPKVQGLKTPRLATPRLNPDQGKHIPINPFRGNWQKMGTAETVLHEAGEVARKLTDAIPERVKHGILGAGLVGAGVLGLKATADQAINPHPEGVGLGAGARAGQKVLTLGLSRAGSEPVRY